MGEPAGIGPDVILMAHAHRSENDGAPFVVFGDEMVFAERAKTLGLPTRITRIDAPDEAMEVPAGTLPLIAIDCPAPVQPGLLDTATGPATVQSLQTALQCVRAGTCSAVVTAPVHKSSLYATGFAFPGHTEFLEAFAKDHWPDVQSSAVMMMAGSQLRTVPVTVHVPLEDVATLLTSERLMTVARCVASDLQTRFDIKNPRLAVAGLNPHAGEDGAMGGQDAAIIAPAVDVLQAEGIDVTGPLPADTMFHPEARATYDVALCMYHDQALIPAKTLDFHGTVNVTLGLPFVRTSPDHGTALDLAGTGKASSASMQAAVDLAEQMARRT
jgi:4-hydroxythreonine-4-phosphate dehydrogenase